MGCRFEILIDVDRSGLSRAECAAVCEEMRELVLDWHARLSVFEEGTIISRFNRGRAGDAFVLDDDLFALCSLCDRLRLDTDGAFNIAAGTLMEAHGFRESVVDDLDGLSIDKGFVLDKTQRTITKTDGRIRIDFGGIAKGFVLDLIRNELEELGITDAFVHGGTSSVMGMGRGWSAGVGDGMTATLEDLSLGVSETDSRVVDGSGHVMDPQTMAPATSSLQRVACVHKSAAAADAYATACCVWPNLIERLGDGSCTLIVFDTESEPIAIDPLGVVRPSPEDQE